MRDAQETKLIIVGQGRAGKTRVAKLAAAILDCTAQDSSTEMLSVVETHLAHHGISYDSVDEMKADKVSHREKWATAISNYCKERGATAVADRIYASNRIYVGPRKMSEYLAIREKYKPLSIWVARQVPQTADMEISSLDCDVVLDNMGDWVDTVGNLLGVLDGHGLL